MKARLRAKYREFSHACVKIPFGFDNIEVLLRTYLIPTGKCMHINAHFSEE
jgi:hypothetical protein